MMNKQIHQRIKLTDQDFDTLTRSELREKWRLQECYMDTIESLLNEETKDKSDLISLRESEEKLKHQQLEANRRENILVMRLTTKEQEMQDYMNQIQELKQAQIPSTSQLQSTLVDPAVNLMFEKMKKEVDAAKAKVEEMQSELSAWKFTPDSNTGKRLMAKCRLLYQENEELGKLIASGRVAKLESDLSLQKSFSDEMKKSQSELDEFLLELDEDVEGMQSTIYLQQQQLKEAKDQITLLQQELNSKVTFNSITTPESPPVTMEVETNKDERWNESPATKDEVTTNVDNSINNVNDVQRTDSILFSDPSRTATDVYINNDHDNGVNNESNLQERTRNASSINSNENSNDYCEIRNDDNNSRTGMTLTLNLSETNDHQTEPITSSLTLQNETTNSSPSISDSSDQETTQRRVSKSFNTKRRCELTDILLKKKKVGKLEDEAADGLDSTSGFRESDSTTKRTGSKNGELNHISD